jgi:hypothetical protein
VAAEAPELAAGVRSGMTDRERLLDELRPVAFAIAYRMLGSVTVLRAGLLPIVLPTACKSEPTLLIFVTGKNWPICRQNKEMGAAGFEPATSRV